MKIINPTEFYKILITEGENSLYSNNTYTDNNGYLQNYLDLHVFNKTGEWLDNQINEFNTSDDVDETTYGNFEYLGTVLDDTSYIVPQYTELFKLEVLALEKERDLVIDLFDTWAAGLNNYQYTDDNNDIQITLGEHATPVYGDKQDIGGAERFIVSLSILCRVTTGVITSRNIELKIYNNEDDLYETVKFVSLNFKRETDAILDNKAGYEKTYDVNKTDFTIIVGSLYLDDYFSRTCMKYALDPIYMEDAVKLKYKDFLLDIEKEYELYLVSVNPNIQFGIPISYTASFKIKNN